ncbi:MAG: hypothetical protein GXY57_04140, partial [Erysipelotrichaceae bacterium]|nr:hypothetical protein [Erysipelotrichaceae bacterium]
MKKRYKLGLGAIALTMGAIILTSCTASFCSVTDKSHILYLFDYGVTSYYGASNEETEPLTIDLNGVVYSTNLYKVASFDKDNAKYINKINEAAEASSLRAPTLNYFASFDDVVLANSLARA